jgi:hypothetical protein
VDQSKCISYWFRSAKLAKKKLVAMALNVHKRSSPDQPSTSKRLKSTNSTTNKGSQQGSYAFGIQFCL